MRRALLLVVTSVLIASAPAMAQRGGGMRGGGGGMRAGGGGVRSGGLGGFRGAGVGAFHSGGFQGGFFHQPGFRSGFGFRRFGNFGFTYPFYFPAFYGGYGFYDPYFDYYPYSNGYYPYGYPSASFSYYPPEVVVVQSPPESNPPPPLPPAAATPQESNYDTPLYLLAYQDGSIRAALAYWVDGTTLHYVTMDHEQKQAPLASIDRALSERLNRERNVTFRLPR